MIDLNVSANGIEVKETDVIEFCTEESTSKVTLDEDLKSFELVEQPLHTSDISQEKNTITQVQKQEQNDEVTKKTTAQIKMDLEKDNMVAMQLNQAVEIEHLREKLLLREHEIMLLKQSVEIAQLRKELVLRDQELLSLKQTSERIDIVKKDEQCVEVKTALMENTFSQEKLWSIFSHDSTDVDHAKTIRVLKLEIASLNSRLQYLERQESYKNNISNSPIRKDCEQAVQNPVTTICKEPFAMLPKPASKNTSDRVFAVPHSIFNTAPERTSLSLTGTFYTTPTTASSTCCTFHTTPRTIFDVPNGLFDSNQNASASEMLDTARRTSTTTISGTCGMFESAPASASSSCSIFTTAPTIDSGTRCIFQTARPTVSESRIVFESAFKTLPSSGGVFTTAPITVQSNHSIFQTAPTTVSGIFSIFKPAATIVSGSHIVQTAPTTVSGICSIFKPAATVVSGSHIFQTAPTNISNANCICDTASKIASNTRSINTTPTKMTMPTGCALPNSAPKNTLANSGIFDTSITASGPQSIINAASTTASATSTGYRLTPAAKTASASDSVTSTAAQHSNSRKLLTTCPGRTNALDFESNRSETAPNPCMKVEKDMKSVKKLLVSLRTRVDDLEKRQTDLSAKIMTNTNGVFTTKNVTNWPSQCTQRNSTSIFGPKNNTRSMFSPQNTVNSGTSFSNTQSNTSISGIGGYKQNQSNPFAIKSRNETQIVKFSPVQMWERSKDESVMVTCDVHCITVMPQYEHVSMEELRLEHYKGRKLALKWWEQTDKRTGIPAANNTRSGLPLLFG